MPYLDATAPQHAPVAHRARPLLNLLVLTVFAMPLPQAALAVTVPVNKCLAGKLKAVGKSAASRLGCYSKAARSGVADPDCLAKASAKFSGGADPAAGAFGKLEAKFAGAGDACLTLDDQAAFEAALAAYAASVAADTGVAGKCDAAKIKCVGKYVAAMANCSSKAAGKSGLVDPACSIKALAKLATGTSGCLDKAALQPACSQPGSQATELQEAADQVLLQSQCGLAACPPATPTEVAAATATATAEPSATSTAVVSETPTQVPTDTPTEVASPTPTETATATPTETATVLPTETATLTPTDTPTASPTTTPTATASASPTIPAIPGLLAQWKFDEGSGGVVGDSSGNGFHGYGTAPHVAGHSGTARAFQNLGDIVTVPSAPAFIWGENNSDYTIAYWIKAAAPTGSWRSVLHKGTVDAERYPAHFVHPSVTVLHFVHAVAGSPNDAYFTPAFAADTWTHFAEVHNGTTNQKQVYLNASLVLANVVGPTLGSTAQLYLGGSPWFPALGGALDDVRIYRRALSPAEVSQVYVLP